MLERLYGAHAGWKAFCTALTQALRQAWAERPEDLKWLDMQRDLEPDWFQRPDRAGYVFYLDRFNGDLKGRARPDRLAGGRSGITYVHFMPCLEPRPGDSDGGYSVMDYRAINPAYGTMADFEAVAGALRAARHQRLRRPRAQPYRQGARLGEKARARRRRSIGTTT